MAWKKLLFSERTPYQLVEIYSTLDFGNVLVLDGFTNLAESDLIYTHSLMCKGVQVRNKEITIASNNLRCQMKSFKMYLFPTYLEAAEDLFSSNPKRAKSFVKH